MSETLRFLLVLEGLGLAGLPLAARALRRLPGAGLGFARVLALLLWAWLVWLLGSLGVPNGTGLVVGAAAVVALGALAAWRLGDPVPPDPFGRRLVLGAEGLFLAAFLAAVLLVSFAADTWGTEKPMDMMLINATTASDGFPPHDPWMSGEQTNYYYLGQLAFGLLARVTGVEPTVGYNLALAALFALAVTAAFTSAATLAEAAGRQGLPVRRPLLAGVAAVVLLAVMGNLRGGWDAVTTTGPLESFQWFQASRVIPNTINEFPSFSFTVGDLHAHVIAIPLSLLALAFVAQLAMEGPPRVATKRGAWETGCAALAIGILYAVNSWSWPVLAGLLVLGALLWLRDERSRGQRVRALAWCAGVLALGIVLVLPFIVDFDPNAGGIGTVGEAQREPLGRFLGHLLVLYGALLWLLAAPLAARALGARHPARIAVWGAAVLVVGLSLTAEARLAGALLVALGAGVALAAALRRDAVPAERLLWALAATALALIAAPEVVYVRDEFEPTQFIRMNTVFKLGYQAWILLAVVGAVSLSASRAWLPRIPRAAWQSVAAVLVVVSCAYPVAAAAGRTAGFADGPRLDGREWLARTAPGDVAAIDWLRAHAPGDAVVLEAVGDDYSPFGNGRISTYTGRPTVLGWQGHELQWSHDVGTRRTDVQALYTTRDAAAARELVRRYGVDYAVIGPLERTTYGDPGVLPSLGRKVFERDGTVVYALTASGR